jgi:hypothetical protein
LAVWKQPNHEEEHSSRYFNFKGPGRTGLYLGTRSTVRQTRPASDHDAGKRIAMHVFDRALNFLHTNGNAEATLPEIQFHVNVDWNGLLFVQARPIPPLVDGR